MDFDFVRSATTGGAVGLALAGLIVFLVVRNLLSKIVTLALIAALAGGALYYRKSLDDCVKTCSCRLGPTHIPVNGHGCANKH